MPSSFLATALCVLLLPSNPQQPFVAPTQPIPQEELDRINAKRMELDSVTYTLKYPGVFGFRIRRMRRHYEPATIEVVPVSHGVIDVRTKNGAILEVSRGVGSEIRLGNEHFDLVRAAEGNLPVVLFTQRGEQWEMMDYTSSLGELGRNFSVNRPGVQGPIDDAFTDSFLCVRGTGNRGPLPWQTRNL